MTQVIAELQDLEGAELTDALEQRFTTEVATVETPMRTFSILRPRNSDDLIREEDFVKDERLPYWADIWPSATVLVGYCDSGDRTPSLLVVDDQTLKGCAMAPDTGGLSPFYKEVNGLAVWEISPRGEPLLLDAVRSCRE